MNRYFLIAMLLLVSASAGVRAGQAVTERVAFEVASVRPNPDTRGRAIALVPPSGGVLFTHHSVLGLIYYAYGLKSSYALAGAPDWARQEQFDIRANPAAGSPSDAVPRMMQSLLEERFKLRVHREMRELPVYLLSLPRPEFKPGPDLKPSKHDCAAFFATGATLGSPDAPRDEDGRIACGTNIELLPAAGEFRLRLLGVTMSEATLRFESFGGLGRPITDRTGLAGAWNVTLWFSRPLPATLATEVNAPTIETAVREQLGMRLEAARESRPVLVIDSVERPTPD